MPAEKVTGQVPEGPYPFTKHERTLLMRGFGSHRMLCGILRIRVKRNIPLSGDLKKEVIATSAFKVPEVQPMTAKACRLICRYHFSRHTLCLRADDRP